MQGNAPLHPGQGPGLSLYDLGQMGGSETVTLLESEIPAHAHALRGSLDDADLAIPAPTRTLARGSANLYAPAGSLVAMAPEALAPAGGDQPHNNMQPYLTLNFNIALQGVFPARP
jgi:microcystin-dependent protein